MVIKILNQKKDNADWYWDNVFERAKKGEATIGELVAAMDLCNTTEENLINVQYRMKVDSLKGDKTKMAKYFQGYAWYRPEDSKLFISNGEKFISQKLPYEAISFSKMDELLGQK